MTWLYLPFKESNSSQASACWARDCEPGSTTWISRIAPCATLNGKLTQPQFWSRAWKKARWMRHLSGPTLPPSTLESGAGKWIASLPDSHAKTCPSPAGVPGLMGRGPVFSSRSSELRTIAMRGSSFWRTSAASLLPPPPLWTRKKESSKNVRPPESWGNWPTAGGMRNGSLFPRPTWVPATAESDGFASHGEKWLTPHEMDTDDHLALLDALRGVVDGMVVLSGYASDLYDQHLPGWEKRTTKALISGGRGTVMREEVVWLNPACVDALHGQQGLFASAGNHA